MSAPRPRSASHSSSRSRQQIAAGQDTSRPDPVPNGSPAAIADRSYGPRSSRPDPTASNGLSSSANVKTPTRSFYHRSFHGPLDAAHYASPGVREETAELASLALSESAPGVDNTSSYDHEHEGRLRESGSSADGDRFHHESTRGGGPSQPEVITEVSEPVSPIGPPVQASPGASALTELIRSSPPLTPSNSSERDPDSPFHSASSGPQDEMPVIAITDSAKRKSEDERRPLIPKDSFSAGSKVYGTTKDLEHQSPRISHCNTRLALGHALDKAASVGHRLVHPKTWDRKAIWQAGVVQPASLLPAVFLGLLLNILDALSYGMILFPLGEPMFADLGSDGISIFYVSTIISQLVFSCGGSIFKGGIGSEMIEVVPFFHKMAFTILNKVGKDNEKAVLATTILSYAISSILTGTVFFLMGACRLGSLIGFFPRHILIGCIGGVGWFLVATGVEVSARLSGNLEYNLATLQKLFHLDTVFLWLVPLILAVLLLFIKRLVKSNFLVGGYFVCVACIFYFFKFALHFDIETLRSGGWVFDAPEAGNPWYHFYKLYDFKAVDWSALGSTVPAMFALTFFGVLHVPINVPALGISTGEDNLNLDRELIAHGVSNALSGLAGSIQNYLVYTNSLLFINSGGNHRLAGIMLAIGTFGIMIVGPIIIGFIPIMVVGALIFMLGIELMEEALVDTIGRLHALEYLTVVIIVVTMGAWDFVAGILVGIILACVNFVVQTSRKSAIRATYSGEIAGSTVRRHPAHRRFLKEAGQQIHIIKLAGFLFFGTIVSVENRIRALLEDEAFHSRPIRFLVLDLAHVNGLDFSAAEAFTRINRILSRKNVHLVVSGLDVDGDIGKSLHNVGLFSNETEVPIFEDLNSALEYCENDLLKAFYQRKEALAKRSVPDEHLAVPRATKSPPNIPSDTMFSSPRRHYLNEVATTTLNEPDAMMPQKWQAFKQPLPLLLQTFQGLTDENEDFWFRACAFFVRKELIAGSVLFYEGDSPNGFYILEEGILRAEYDMPQGRYYESIVAGRPCGELPFFSETKRTATVTAERDCTVWQLTVEKWAELQLQEPDVAQEFLRVSLKLTTERMDAITSYVLTTAG